MPRNAEASHCHRRRRRRAFAAVKACAEEGRVAFHPKEIEDEAKKLMDGAAKLWQQEETLPNEQDAFGFGGGT